MNRIQSPEFRKSRVIFGNRFCLNLEFAISWYITSIQIKTVFWLKVGRERENFSIQISLVMSQLDLSSPKRSCLFTRHFYWLKMFQIFSIYGAVGFSRKEIKGRLGMCFAGFHFPIPPQRTGAWLGLPAHQGRTIDHSDPCYLTENKYLNNK